MSLNPTQTLSQLHSILREQTPVESGRRKSSAAFLSRLDQALERGEAPENSSQESLRKAAEMLRLETLRSSLKLLEDQAVPSQNFINPAASNLNQPSAIQTYIANQLASENSTGQLKRSQPLPAEIEPGPIPIAKLSLLDENSNRPIDSVIQKAARQYGVDPDLVRAVIKAESNFNPKAVSHAGAQGLMQLMPSTARGLGVKDSFNPEQNVMGGTKFLKGLLERYNGDLDSALAAYNWGPGNVDKKPDKLPRETRDYLAKVKQYYNSYQG